MIIFQPLFRTARDLFREGTIGELQRLEAYSSDRSYPLARRSAPPR